MNEGKVEFRQLDYKVVGSDIVVFKLEDESVVEVQVRLNRVGVRLNFRNPDGSPAYHIDIGNMLRVIPHDRKFLIDKDQLPPSAPAQPKKEAMYG